MRRICGGHGFFVARMGMGWCALRWRTHFLFWEECKVDDMIRYSVITEKNPREIVLLRGSGCVWKKCAFCDYHLDASTVCFSNSFNILIQFHDLSEILPSIKQCLLR